MRDRARRYLAVFFAAFLGSLAALTGLLAALDAAGRLPPPALSGRWELDLTLQHWRQEPPGRFDLLFAGSSVAFYGVDGQVIAAGLGPAVRFHNVGVLGAKIHQSRFWLGFLLDLHPEVAEVVFMSTPLDFEACPPGTARLFDPAEVRDYLAGRWPEMVHRLRHLDLWDLPRRVVEWPHRLSLGPDQLETVRLWPWGGQLLDVPRERVPAKIVHGVLPDPDPRCYAALAGLLEDLAARGVRVRFFLAPMRPGYLRLHDPDGSRLFAQIARLREILDRAGTPFHDLHARLAFPEEAFFDAYHLRAPWVRRQSRELVRILREDGPDPLTARASPARSGAAGVP